jgi:predicted DsbA family dithiol-disulfide isomerase
MQAILWRDYLCPWCYLGRSRTAVMRRHGVDVIPLAYDLHPEVPAGGRAIRPGGRYDRVLDHISSECAAEGLPFRKPARTPNTRRALEIGEILRVDHASAFEAYDDACYRIHWLDGGDLGDDGVLREAVASAGLDPAPIEQRIDEGRGARLVEESMGRAREQGVAATPAWWVDERLLIPGAQPTATVERWITRLVERAAP